MFRPPCLPRVAPVLLALMLTSTAGATAPDRAEQALRQFLAQDDAQPSYRAVRHLEARNGRRFGWVDAITDYSPDAGFRYEITAEGGSGFVRHKLKSVLEAEQDVIASGETSRSSIDLTNYTFEPEGVGPDGLAHILLSPRREDRVLVRGRMALTVTDGELVRLQGRLAKHPSFWVKDVDIVRIYRRLCGEVVPVRLDSTAQLRFFGEATFRMTYAYSEIAGQKPVVSGS